MWLLLATPAQAQDYEPKTLPQCHIYFIDGKSICGYADVEDWKLVLKSDAELVHLRNKVRFMEEFQSNQEGQLQSLNRQLDLSAEQAAVLGAENTQLTKDLIALDKKYQDERVKPQWGSTVAWSIAGISTAALAGILLISVVD